MSAIEAIYRTLHEAGECRSARDFSVRWLAKSPNYLAQLRFSGSAPDRSSVVLLEHLLWERYRILDQVRDYRVQAARTRMVFAAMLAADLADQLDHSTRQVPHDEDEC